MRHDFAPGDDRTFAVAGVQVDRERAEHRGDVREPGGPELAGKFGIAARAGLEAADQLGDDRPVDDDRRVRLLDAEEVDPRHDVVTGGLDRVAYVGADRPSPHGHPAAPVDPARADQSDDVEHARLVDEGVDDRGSALSVLVLPGRQLGDDGVGVQSPYRRGPVAVDEGEGHQVALVLAVAERRSQDEEGDPAVREDDDVVHEEFGDLLVLGPEPTTSRQPGTQGPVEPPAAYHVRPRSGHRRYLVLLASLGRLQLEPEEAVGDERQVVREFADRCEAGAAEHLDGGVVDVVAQVELDRLRQTREVGDDEDGVLVGQLAEEGEDVGVLRLEERDLAPAELGQPPAQGDELAHPAQQ